MRILLAAAADQRGVLAGRVRIVARLRPGRRPAARRRRGLWIALAGQAGSTADEDFPGLAALVSPAGTVTDRLPDWRPGTLIVDVPQPA